MLLFNVEESQGAQLIHIFVLNAQTLTNQIDAWTVAFLVQCKICKMQTVFYVSLYPFFRLFNSVINYFHWSEILRKFSQTIPSCTFRGSSRGDRCLLLSSFPGVLLCPWDFKRWGRLQKATELFVEDDKRHVQIEVGPKCVFLTL